MKAVCLKDVGQAEVIDVSEPRPAAGEVLLRVEMVGLCGTDLNSFRGRNPLLVYPRVLGHEIAATVVEGTKSIAQGTCVTVSPYTSCGVCASCLRGRPNACSSNQTLGVQRDGALTEWISLPESKLYPAALSLEELCLVEPLTVGFHAVARGRVTAQDTVAVIGCGGVGLGAIAGAAFRGARVIAVDVDADKLEIARTMGAAEIVNTSESGFEGRLRALTEQHGPDVIIEAVGSPETYRMAVEEVAFTGRVVYIGYARTPVAYETKLFVQKELDILGARNALPEDFKEVIAMLESKRYPATSAISAIAAINEAPAMLAKWADSPHRFTKILIRVRD
jgi:threonine dehydrogenase-like Zn-dependent dehydrogenase